MQGGAQVVQMDFCQKPLERKKAKAGQAKDGCRADMGAVAFEQPSGCR